ncbi:glycosyltransferase family A protein [Croceibacter atlanticus]|uniref:glycosyltransferase family 2 protein n=1 Tax=Croceibacter atlanticus TaxID=313588 RepID=UPI0030DC3BA6|tara:strand:- start:85027 stop:85941 length:915 start_codon:yes stop_codon:yes gene_type:complete
MKTITVFTTTYNRAHLLPRLYKSLCKQTNQDFLWLIIDDGSTDNTKEIATQWIKAKEIEIKYKFKKNGGMHTGHNMAYKLMQTEYNVCVDSDDYLLPDSIQKIIGLINKYDISKNEQLAGIIGLNITLAGKVIGNKFPKDILQSSYQDISFIYKAIGDKKIVFKTKKIKNLKPYPTFYPEKFVPLYFPIVLDSKFEYLCFNEIFCVVEYQEDGSTVNIYNQYINNPKGCRFSRKIEMIYYKSVKRKFKSAIHLISSNLILKEINLVKDSPNIIITVLAIPFGIAWYFYILYKLNSKRDISKYLK